MSRYPEHIVAEAKRMYATYLGSSLGLSWNSEPVPTWDELGVRDTMETDSEPVDYIRPGSVRDHWCAVAEDIHSRYTFTGANTLPPSYRDGDLAAKRAAFGRYIVD